MNSLLLLKHELLLTALLLIFILIKLLKEISNHQFFLITCVLLAVNFLAGFFGNSYGSVFGNMFHTNEFISIQKNILNLATLLIVLSSWSWLKHHHHVPEFFILLLTTLLGMFFMLSSGNFLMFYLSLELATIPLAALCNFDLEKKQSSEAGMKMILLSALASAVLLLGISFIYGTTGTISFTELSFNLTGHPLQVFGFILVFAGFAFKLSVIPFHLWTADVYEGSPVAITAYLSVVSKGAMVFIFTTILYTVFRQIENTGYNTLFITAVVTMTIGNLFAIRQQNLKRFLAFSSIAQVGFILVGLSGYNQLGISSATYFIFIYVFSNLAAFAVVGLISAASGKENINDYRGLAKTNPSLAWIMALSLFSLAGIPPTAGFFGKFFLLAAGAGKGNFVLITIAALNIVLSLYYYLRVIRVMFMDQHDSPIPNIKCDKAFNTAAVIFIAGILIAGIWDYPFQIINTLAPYIFTAY
ncbi:MAG: NADH-quinone oxidoreductase subunit N [Bacteroidia bacterium]|nr:NADH-quinone oxidoreductase subunit N [Bacteroidia bacterium]MCZ2278044.1 NADH-quinone oxidoreductase subunit N [Bacteroidia bacterium]